MQFKLVYVEEGLEPLLHPGRNILWQQTPFQISNLKFQI